MTMQPFFQKCFTLTVGTIAGCAIAGGMPPQAVQAVVFGSTLTVYGTDTVGTFVPLAASTFTYDKIALPTQQFGYTLLDASITSPFLPRSYTLADLPTYTSQIQVLLASIPSPYQSYVTKYQGALYNAIARESGLPSNEYDYIGDGDFPPPDAILNFTGQDIPSDSWLQTLFPQGGRVTFSSTEAGVSSLEPPQEFTPQSLAALLGVQYPPQAENLPAQLPGSFTPIETGSVSGVPTATGGTAAVPEPTTVVGAGLAAGAAAIARRRKKMAA